MNNINFCCKKCKINKNISNYFVNNELPNKHWDYCIDCFNKINRSGTRIQHITENNTQ